MTQPRESRLIAEDGTPLFVADWPAERDSGRGRGVLLMHGLGEHCGRYAHVAAFFNRHGWSVRGYDHRGHGRSGGARGDLPDEQALLRDARLVLDDFAATLAVPPLLLGHSMGGLFAARFALERTAPLSGLILSSPALAVSLSGGQKLLLKMLSAVAPGMAVPNGLQTRYLSHDPAVEQAYISDPLVHTKITARLLRAMRASIDRCQAGAAELAVPTLMIVAGSDRLVDARGSDVFHARLAPGIGTLHRYPDYYHELFNEVGAARVFEDLRIWLEKLPATLPVAAARVPAS